MDPIERPESHLNRQNLSKDRIRANRGLMGARKHSVEGNGTALPMMPAPQAWRTLAVLRWIYLLSADRDEHLAG
jgi:hypothetical protein